MQLSYMMDYVDGSHGLSNFSDLFPCMINMIQPQQLSFISGALVAYVKRVPGSCEREYFPLISIPMSDNLKNPLQPDLMGIFSIRICTR